LSRRRFLLTARQRTDLEEDLRKMKSVNKNKNQRWLVIPAVLVALLWALSPFISSSAAGSEGFFTAAAVSDTEIEASLTGNPINNMQPFGRARYRVEDNGRRRFEIEVFSVNLPAGTALNVRLNGTNLGQLFINSFNSGQFQLRTDNGQTVPNVNNGDVVTLTNGSTTVLNGTFGITLPSPSPTGSPTGSPSPSPTGSPTGSPSPSPTGSPTGSPSPSPTGSPTGSPSPSPTGSPNPSPSPNSGDLFAQLTGAPINGGVPSGFAEYSLHQSGTNRRIRVFVNSVSLPAGTLLNVTVGSANVGQFALQGNGYGEFRIESRDFPNVPVVTPGTTVVVSNNGASVLSGIFNGGSASPSPSPSPTGSPTGSPSPSPTGSPNATPSPSPTASPSPAARFFDAEIRGSQVVPQINSDARGSARILLNDAGNQIQVVLSFFGLTGNQTSASINAPALPGQVGPAIFELGTIGGTSGFFPTRTFAITPAQLAQLRAGTWYVQINSATNPNGEIRGQVRAEDNRGDFEGDGLTDLAVFRPSNSTWYFQNSSDGNFRAQVLGSANDTVVSGDYDGDGVSDIAVFKNINGVGYWSIRRSSDGVVTTEQWGLGDDKPAAADFDGDGRNDLAVFRPSNGAWYVRRSFDNSFFAVQWGTNGDLPVAGDFDGDGKADVAVFRPSNGYWYVLRSSNGALFALPWGTNGDIPQAGDFDGDGQTDVAVFRPSNGYWYARRSIDGSLKAIPFGTNGDIAVAGEFDADGITDVAVFRPSNGYWYVLRSADDQFVATPFGTNGDRPAAGQ
jgi:hypothetical protein